MKKKKLFKDIFTTCLSVFVAGASLSSLCNNMQINADEQMVPYLEYRFDKKLDGWQTTGAPRVGFDTENPHSGEACIKISNRNDNSYSMAITAYDMFSTGYKYKFSVYLYQSTETDQVMSIVGRTQSGNESNIASGPIPPNQWTELVGECVIYETDSVNYLFISSEDGTIDYKLDDFVIYRQESTPIVKTLGDNDYSNQMSYEESVASQQKAAKEVEKKDKEDKKVNETKPKQTSVQMISKEEDSSDKGFTVILIVGIVFALVCLGISIILVISRKKKNPVTSSSVDALTKFPNKTEYENSVLHFINNPDECSNIKVLICSVCFINYINDNYGTETGDSTLVRCANCIRKALGNSAKVYRSDGNEFMCFSESSMIDAVKKAIEEESKTDNGYPFACAVGEASFNESKAQNSNSDIRNTIMKADEIMEKNKEKIVSETHLSRHFPNKK